MNVQIIEKDGQPEYAVLPYEEYIALTEAAEMVMDIAAYDTAVVADDPLIPNAVVKRLVAGESPLRVWRNYRSLTQVELAQQAGLSQQAIAKAEQTGLLHLDSAAKLAAVLDIGMDDLIPQSREQDLS